MKFGEILQEVETQTAEYAATKKQEREDVSIVANNGVMLITSDPASYSAYLDLQAANPRISPLNLGLVMDAMPEATTRPDAIIVKQLET